MTSLSNAMKKWQEATMSCHHAANADFAKLNRRQFYIG